MKYLGSFTNNDDICTKKDLSTVALTGSYDDLTNKPNLSLKEDTSNKVTSLSSSSTDTQYPSAKCVYDLVGDIDTILTQLNSGSGV